MRYTTLNNGASQAMPASGGSSGFLPGFWNVLLGAGGVVLGIFAAGSGGSYSQIPASQIPSVFQSGQPLNYVQEKNELPVWVVPTAIGAGVLIILLVLK